MFRTTLTVLFAALTLSVPAFAQKGATGQDATQTKPLTVLKETEGTYEEVPVVIGGGGTTKPQTGSEVVVIDAAPQTNEPLAYPAKPLGTTVAEPLEFPMAMAKDGGLHLELGLDEGVLHADIFTAEPKFFGGVLLSLSPEVIDAGELGLTLLRDAAVMGLGFGMEGHLALKVPAAKDLAGLEFFGQAVVADGFEIRAGEVVAAIAN